MNIVAISGSLRAASFNTALLRAAASLAPDGMDIAVYEGLGDLPHYSPERDHYHARDLGASPDSVGALRSAIGAADGAIICTPEYAYGIPGSLKNALDWLVSSGELWRKPVAAISASPSASGGDRAFTALLLTLSALEATVPERARMVVPSVKTVLGADGALIHSATVDALRSVLDALAQAVAAPTLEGE